MPSAASWSARCAARSRRGATSGAGEKCSAARWSETSAGLHPLVSTPLSTRGSRDGSSPDRENFGALVVVPVAHRAADRPAAVPEVEARPRAHRVLLRGGERGQRADVAPIGGLLVLLDAGHAVLREVVRVDALAGA